MARRSTDFFQRALGYGAVSYGFGFLVVMTHTWRLGLPLIALLDPVYVWLGLPFAAVAFWSIPIVTSVRQRAVEARAGVAEAFRVDPTTPPSVKGLAETLARSVPILPLSGWSQRVAS